MSPPVVQIPALGACHRPCILPAGGRKGRPYNTAANSVEPLRMNASRFPKKRCGCSM